MDSVTYSMNAIFFTLSRRSSEWFAGPFSKDGAARLISGEINTRSFNRLVLAIVFYIENGISTSSVTLLIKLFHFLLGWNS
jgi:hypothetical protein